MRAVFLILMALSTLFSDVDRSELYFMPQDGKLAEKRVIELIKSSKNRVDIAMFSFTNKRIANALKIAAKKGVKIRVVADKEANIDSKYSQIGTLAALKSVDVYIAKGLRSKNGRYYGKMHLKLAVIDSHTTIFGSANWSKSAFESNYEMLFITYDYAVAKKSRSFINRVISKSTSFY